MSPRQNRGDVPLTAEQLAELESLAIPCTGLALSPTGDVLIRGRHELGIADVVIRVAPEDALNVAHMIAMGLLGTVRALHGAAARGATS